MRLVNASNGGGRRGGYSLLEALVYIGLVVGLLGAAYLAFYRCVDNSMVLRRGAGDVGKALHLGEAWRADIRSATRPPWFEKDAEGETLWVEGARGQVGWRFQDGAVLRSSSKGIWVCVLDRVEHSKMEPGRRHDVTVWQWELELSPRAKGQVNASRVRPLFSFLAVPPPVAGKIAAGG